VGGKKLNTDNVCTVEAAQKLVGNGIVLRTERHWILLKNSDWYISTDRMPMIQIVTEIPAPSPAEVWRELCRICKPCIYFSNEVTLAVIEGSPSFYNTNLTDALIDLLIWVRKESHEQKSNL
jgi:hypothetical protein